MDLALLPKGVKMIKTVEVGAGDKIVITRDGQVCGFVTVKVRDTFNGGQKVEMVANPVCSYGWAINDKEAIFNDFATTGATNVDSIDKIDSVEQFVEYMNWEV